jgi:hypothetical protein
MMSEIKFEIGFWMKSLARKMTSEGRLTSQIKSPQLPQHNSSYSMQPVVLATPTIMSSSRTAHKPKEDLPLPIGAYAGTFINPGYGSLRLHAPIDTSPEARDILNEYATVGIDASPDAQTLFARWSRNFFTHLSLSHEDGNVFAPRAQVLFPNGYGANKTPFETGTRGAPRSRFEFKVVNEGGHERVIGFAILGSSGPPTPRELAGSTLEERADVWFERI